MSKDVFLKASDVYCSYGAEDSTVQVLKGANIQIESGEVVAVTGPSGSGKSTLLHALGLLEQPDKGEILICKKNGWLLSSKKRAEIRNRNIGFVFQFHHLLEEFTLLENVMMPSLIAGVNSHDAAVNAGRLIDRVGISHRASHFPSRVSGGERQRAAIARALVMNPKIVLADEPTGNLDVETSADVEKLMMELASEGLHSFLLATHSLDLAAGAHRRYSLNKGILSESE